MYLYYSLRSSYIFSKSFNALAVLLHGKRCGLKKHADAVLLSLHVCDIVRVATSVAVDLQEKTST